MSAENSDSQKTLPKPFISIIVPAHNEEAYLVRTLEALDRQTHANFEVIVVPNGCSDRTPEIARQRCAKVIHLPQSGLSRARNRGAQEARGQLLIFLDADTLLQPEALELIAGQFTREAAAGTMKARPDRNRLAYHVIYFFKNLLHWSRLHGGSSGTIICWKDQFEAVGGFDEALHVRENSHLIRRLRRLGKYQFIDCTIATTSMRRYDQVGTGETLFLWFKVWVQSLISDIRNKPYQTVR